MKWYLYAAVITLMTSGCARDMQIQSQHQAAVSAQNRAVLESVKEQTAANELNRIRSMTAMSSALSAASKTPGAGDDVGVAMAWGYLLNSDQEVHIPNLQPIPKPITGIDYMHAALPYANLISPWFGWAGAFGDSRDDTENSPTTVVKGEGNTVLVDSANAGSYNKSKGDQAIATAQAIDLSTCIDCENDPSGVPPVGSADTGGGIDNGGGDNGSGDSGLDSCLADPYGYSDSGTPLFSPGCSCRSHYVDESC